MRRLPSSALPVVGGHADDVGADGQRPHRIGLHRDASGTQGVLPCLAGGATRRHPAALSGPLGDAAPAALAVLDVALLGVALLGVARTLPVPAIHAPTARGTHVVVVIVEGGAGEQQVGKRRALCGRRRCAASPAVAASAAATLPRRRPVRPGPLRRMLSWRSPYGSLNPVGTGRRRTPTETAGSRAMRFWPIPSRLDQVFRLDVKDLSVRVRFFPLADGRKPVTALSVSRQWPPSGGAQTTNSPLSGQLADYEPGSWSCRSLLIGHSRTALASRRGNRA